MCFLRWVILYKICSSPHAPQSLLLIEQSWNDRTVFFSRSSAFKTSWCPHSFMDVITAWPTDDSWWGSRTLCRGGGEQYWGSSENHPVSLSVFAIVGCSNMETDYRSVVEDFVLWCRASNLQVNMSKTKELVGYDVELVPKLARIKTTRAYAPASIKPMLSRRSRLYSTRSALH